MSSFVCWGARSMKRQATSLLDACSRTILGRSIVLYLKKAVCLASFLLIIGVAQYIVLVQLLNEVHTDQARTPSEQVVLKTIAELENLQRWREHKPSKSLRGQESMEEQVEKDPRDSSRELRDLRINHLKSLRKNSYYSSKRHVEGMKQERNAYLVRYRNNEVDWGQLRSRKEELVSRNGGGAADPFSDSVQRRTVLEEGGHRVNNEQQWKQLMVPAVVDRKREAEKDTEEEKEEEEEEEEKERHKNDWIFDFEVITGENGEVIVRRKQLEPEILVENSSLPVRKLTAFEQSGGNIMLTIRTTVKNHKKRLPLLFETWLTKVDSSRVFLVTDGPDHSLQLLAKDRGMHYVDAKCGSSYSREQLCCKAGVELSLMDQPQNQVYNWFCHVDDDMYVIEEQLVNLLSVYNPKKDAVYIGRAGSEWDYPRKVKKKAGLGKPGIKFHFAVGGMYCLSRTMLERTRMWLGSGDSFAKSCSLTLEPEDVTVGFIIGVLLNQSLSRTELINTHGLHLASIVDPYTLHNQVAVSYGYGSVQWGEEPYNAVVVPNALFTLEEDESQFRSLHCMLYPKTLWCIEKLYSLIQEWKRESHNNTFFPFDVELTP